MQWWLWRLPLLLLVAAVLTVVVAALRRFERPQRWTIPDPTRRRPHRDAATAAGAGLALLGLVVIPMACQPSVVLLVIGYWLTVRSARATATTHDAQRAP